MGVVAYEVGEGWNVATIRLLNGENREIGNVVTARAFDGSRFVRIDRPETGERLIGYWNGKSLDFDPGDGKFRRIGLDGETGTLVGDGDSLVVFRQHEETLKLAVAAAAEVLATKSRRKVIPTLPIGEGSWNGPVDWNVNMFWLTWYYPSWDGSAYVSRQIGCVGPEVRGNAYGELSRSAICADAQRDANFQCSNRYCLGCCELGSCDAFCMLGDDYLCVVAGVTGRACGLY